MRSLINQNQPQIIKFESPLVKFRRISAKFDKFWFCTEFKTSRSILVKNPIFRFTKTILVNQWNDFLWLRKWERFGLFHKKEFVDNKHICEFFIQNLWIFVASKTGKTIFLQVDRTWSDFTLARSIERHDSWQKWKILTLFWRVTSKSFNDYDVLSFLNANRQPSTALHIDFTLTAIASKKPPHWSCTPQVCTYHFWNCTKAQKTFRV